MTDPLRPTFLTLGALFGLCYAFVLPPMQAPDEFAHVNRAYGIAEGTCVAATLTPVPHSIEELSAAFPPKLETVRRISSGDISPYLHMPLGESQQDRVPNQAANMYSCFPYLPGALGIEAGRVFRAPPGVMLYLIRLANLTAYLGVLYVAFRLLPDFQIPLLCLTLTPMALSQAASASWDGVAYSTAFILCAYILKLAWDPKIAALQLRHYLTLGGLIVLASLCKTDMWLTPLLVLVPPSRFKKCRYKWAAIAGAILLGLGVIAAWNFVNRENTALWITRIKDWRQISFSDNAAFLYQHPWMFFQAFLRTWAARWQDFAMEFIGKLGWLVVNLPKWAMWLYIGLLGFAAVTGTERARLKPGHRLVCLIVVAIAVLSIFVGMWCAEVPPDYRDSILHGAGHVPGVQGRYFIPFGFPLLLAFSNLLLRVNRKLLLGVAALTILTVNGVAVAEIHRLYYLTGNAVVDYDHKLVKQAGNSQEAAKVFIVRGGRKQWVMHASWITSHGYRWPEDVLVIPSAQLASIPEGDAITEQ